MKITTLNDLFVDQLRDVLSAETQLLKALPKMAKAACCDELREAFEHHLAQTQEHQKRLEEILKMLGAGSKSSTCEAMKGLIEEGKEALEIDGDEDVRGAALICAAQKVEHYEIASYGTLCAWAEQLGQTEALTMLQRTLQEEKDADETLTELAMSGINAKADE